MASQDPNQPTDIAPRDNNAMMRRPLPGAQEVDPAVTATNSPEHITGVPPYAAPPPVDRSHSKHVALPTEDGRIQAYDRRRDHSPEKRGGPNTAYWERRRWEREQGRERDPEAWREHPEYRGPDYYPELPYTDRERYGAAPPSISGAVPMRSPDPRYQRMSAPVGPPRGPPYTFPRYDDSAFPPSGTIQPYRRGVYDEESQFDDYLAWKHSKGRGRRAGRTSINHSPSRARSNTVPKRSHKDSDTSTEIALRIPYLNWMGWTAKGHLVAFLGEFVGTTMFLFFAFAGTQVANVDSRADTNSTTGAATGFNAAVLLYIALVFGFSLMVNVWVFYRISGGLFNPAVTLAMLLVKSVTAFRAGLLLVAQLSGSIFASFLVKTIFPTNFNVRTTLSSTTSLTRGVFIEGILTAELIFAIFMLAKEKHKATFIAPVGIGLALFIAELVGVYYTGGSLNPARSFGPCVVSKTFDREHWIYWVGPGAGAIVAVVFYKFILMMQYELANPGQDESSEEEAKEKAEQAKAKVDQLEEERELDLEDERNENSRL